MKFRWEKKYLYWGITAFLVIVGCIIFFLMLNNFSVVAGWFKSLYNILTPFILAFAFAYLLKPIVNFFEKKATIPFCAWVSKVKAERVKGSAKASKKNQAVEVKQRTSKAPRVLSILITMALTLFALFSLLLMVLPELANTLIGIVNSLPEYLGNLQGWIMDLVESNAGLKEMLSAELGNVNQDIIEWAKANLLPQINNILSGITDSVIGIVKVFTNLIVGIVVSVYILFSKEQFGAQAKKVLFALLPPRAINTVLKTAKRADKVFGGFIIGKIVDSAIISIICFVGMSLFNIISPVDMPFTLLISVIIGVTNIIPFFGPFIGAVPSILLIMLVSPPAAFYFAIFVFLLQQFDGNILGPKILGNSTGLSAFWVMFAILLGGGLFGFIGMLLGVPAFAVIYTIITELLEARLKKRKLPADTEEYYDLQLSVSPGAEETLQEIKDDQ